MKKVLFTATVDSHILHFHMKHIEWFQSQGYEVHVASNGAEHLPGVDKKFNVPFERQPLKIGSWDAYKELKDLLKKNHYDIVHCHTPMGAVLTRLAAKNLRKDGVKVLYTAHGFHFFKGSSPVNWVLYYPVEKILSRYTDCLITINPEDFKTANKHKFKSNNIRYVHGVGVDLEKFHPLTDQEKKELKISYGLKEDAFVLITVGELSHRKNQEMIIDAMNCLIKEIPEARLLIVGKGEREAEFRKLVEEYALEHAIQFLGYRKDVDKLMQLSDVAVSCSRQEGLPVNVMEAMATGLPLVVTDCRGNRDLVLSYLNGYKVEVDDEESLAKYIQLLYQHEDLRKKFGTRSMSIIKDYSDASLLKEMDIIYTFYIAQDTFRAEQVLDHPLTVPVESVSSDINNS